MKRVPERNRLIASLKKQAGWIVPGLLLLFSLGSVLYYIAGPSRGYFHSDCTDSIYWAKAAVDAGRLLNPDFGYAALLPFGANLWLIPMVSIWGMTFPVHIAGMLIFALVYGAALLFLAKQLGYSIWWTAGLTSAMFLLVSGSDKLREIMWGHVIYYSLGILFILVGLALIQKIEKGKRATLYVVLLALFTACVATDGIQTVALYLLPLAGSLLLERLFEPKATEQTGKTRKTLQLVMIMLVATVLGMLLLYLVLARGGIIAGYANAYSTFSSTSTWPDNLRNVVPNLLSLYGISVQDGVSLVSLDSIMVLVKLGGLAVLAVVPAILLVKYSQIDSRLVKRTLWIHIITTFIILFLVVIGNLGKSDWRLIPVLGTAILSTVTGLRWLMSGQHKTLEPFSARELSDQHTSESTIVRRGTKADAIVVRRVATIGLIVILLNAGLSAVEMLRMPYDYGHDNQLHQLADYLKDENLIEGYATFWNAQALTLLSNDHVHVRNIQVDHDGIKPRKYQSNWNWYQDQPTIKRYFILLSTQEYDQLAASPDWRKIESIIEETRMTGTDHTLLIVNMNPWLIVGWESD